MSEESGIYIAKEKLIKLKPNTECCDCGIKTDDSPGKYKWVIYHRKITYCPACADNEGWSYEE